MSVRWRDTKTTITLFLVVCSSCCLSGFLRLSAFVLSVCHRLCLTILLSVCVHQCLAAWTCVCFSAFYWAVSVRVLVSYIVCELPFLSAQCALETVVVLCWLGLPCPILSWFVLSGSVCVSPVCDVSLLCLLFLSFSFVRVSFGCSVHPFFAVFLHSSKASHVQVFHTQVQIKLSN